MDHAESMDLIIACFFKNHSIDDCFPAFEDITVLETMVDDWDNCTRYVLLFGLS
jgi:hypothetical protein